MRTRPTILDQVAARGWSVFERGALNVNLVLERFPWIEDVFESRLHVVYRNENGGWIHHSWPITGWPGVPGLRKPVRPEGTAIIADGQYRGAWMIGEFRMRRALLQHGAKIDVWRDNNRDGRPDPGGKRHHDYFGIHQHVAGAGTDGGLGCMMTEAYADQLELMDPLDRSAEAYGNRFTISVLPAAA